MTITKALLTTTLSLGLLACAGGSQAASWCESGKPVKFAGLNWESGMLLTDVMQFVLKNGYGCDTDSLPGNSISMENALSSNDIQVFAEEWVGRSEVWNKAAAAGKVVGVGAPVVGAVEGWYVPRYVIEGDAKRKLEAKAPNLKRIADLGQYAQVFKDPEEPDKGASTIARPAGPVSWTTAKCSSNTAWKTLIPTSARAPARRWMPPCCRATTGVSRSCSTTGHRRR